MNQGIDVMDELSLCYSTLDLLDSCNEISGHAVCALRDPLGKAKPYTSIMADPANFSGTAWQQTCDVTTKLHVIK